MQGFDEYREELEGEFLATLKARDARFPSFVRLKMVLTVGYSTEDTLGTQCH